MTKRTKPLIAISSCLLGNPVRYNGVEKRNATICEQLSGVVDWLPICPEVGIGLGVPRAPIQLVKTDSGIRVLGVENPAQDVTEALADFARQQAQAGKQICGYIFKSRSPSCGLAGVPVYDSNDRLVVSHGVGEFTRGFLSELEQRGQVVPVIDEIDFQHHQKAAEFIVAAQRISDRLATP